MPADATLPRLWQWLDQLLHPLYALVLKQPAEDFNEEQGGRILLPAREIDGALAGILTIDRRLTPDGKAKRVPAGKGGVRSEGEWKLDDKGYCTTWKGSAGSCFTVIPNGTNKWSVMKGPVVMATWSK